VVTQIPDADLGHEHMVSRVIQPMSCCLSRHAQPQGRASAI
jgi:hypothetical protein